MKIKNKTTTIATMAILILSIAGPALLLPNASANYPPWTIPTFAHIYVATDPIGVGQKATIYIFLTPVYADARVENNYRFHNYRLTITSPTGKVTEQTFEVCQDSTSNQGTTFVPDEIGRYNLTFTFPGQKVNDYPHSPTSVNINDTYAASSASTTMTVQQEPVMEVPYPPPPSEYWTRPIFGENVIWYLISSNWLGSGMPGYGGSTGPNIRCFSGDSIGSLTSHVMWTKSIGQPGGIVGGDNFEIIGNTWFEGTAYAQRYTNPIIVGGMLIYKEPLSFAASGGPTVCVNLFTGEEIWRRNDVPALSFGYIMDYETPNYHGVYPAILFTSNFARAFDAATGEPLFNVTNVPSGTTAIGPIGEQIRYTLFNNGTVINPDYYLCQWNSSSMWGRGVTPAIQTLTNNSGVFYDNLDSNKQNVSISWRNNQAGSPSILAAFVGDILLCRNGSYPTSLAPTGNQPYNYFAVNLNASKGSIGSILWWNTVQPAIDPVYGNITTVSFAGADKSGYFCESYRQTSQFAFFNLRTGALIKVTQSQSALDYYGSTGPGTLHNVIAFGRCYSGAMSGTLYCYDMSTGNILWTYGNGGPGNTTDSGLEYPGHYPIFVKAIGGHDLNDGIIYTIATEHTFETPIYKGGLTRAINASDGTEIYTFTDATGEFGAGSFAIADSYTNFFNSYDSRIYTLGRGPSETTVTVGPESQALGGNIVIKGAVNDISVGLQTTEIQGRFPAGIPACADSSMCDWMAYVYQQQQKPANFTGVNVRLIVLDANGNYQDLGTVTTNSKGQYSKSWTPNIPGDFQLDAYFDGTSGYWPSNAETTFNVAEPAAATTTPQAQQASSLADQYILPGIVAIIVTIAIGFAVTILVLKKRP